MGVEFGNPEVEGRVIGNHGALDRRGIHLMVMFGGPFVFEMKYILAEATWYHLDNIKLMPFDSM